MTSSTKTHTPWLHRPLLPKTISIELVLFTLIVLLAALSRLYGLGDRVMSHDETVHVFYSYELAQGKGYFHTPVSHGPLQFHLIASLFFLFGSNDFTARLPHALASILTIILLWKWRKYLGSAGTITAALLMLISPFMLYYGRYARNEAFVALFGVLTLYAILRFLETGQNRYLLLLSLATALHFTAKETAFIYTAQALLYLAFTLFSRLLSQTWKRTTLKNGFVITLLIGLLLIGAALAASLLAQEQSASPTPPPIDQADPSLANGLTALSRTLAVAGFVGLAIAAVCLVTGYGWSELTNERAFAPLVLLVTFVLPQVAAFPSRWLGWNPLDYQFLWPGWNLAAIFAQAPARTAIVFSLLTTLAIALGLAWDARRFLPNAALFWGIYLVFYTTFFTNPAGFFTGTVGSLGYWLEQQGVHRGSQPWYYYLLVQIPVYEFLPALGLLVALIVGLRRRSPHPRDNAADADPAPAPVQAPVFPLLVWWSLSSLLAYTLAGEKMPWLTVHITWPMILLTAWGLGQVIERVNWHEVWQRNGGWVTLLIAAFLVGLTGMLLGWLGPNPPFQGKTEAQLLASGHFLFWLLVTLGSGTGIFLLASHWQVKDLVRVTTLVVFAFLAVLTARAAFRAAFINYDQASEYLVYAHGARGVKDVIEQIGLISRRTTGGYNELKIAYDAGSETQGVSLPLKWYLRNFPNATPYHIPDESLLDYPVILADSQSFEAIDALTQGNYYAFNYLRMVWPNQNYFNLTAERLRQFVTDRTLRTALFEIWLNRDYSRYAAAVGSPHFTPATWSPADAMRLYVRKSDLEKVWEYNLLQQIAIQSDPYEQGMLLLAPDLTFGQTGVEPGQLQSPHGLAIAPDGSLFVADTNNHRIQHFSPDGVFLNAWGSFGDNNLNNDAPIGLFNQPGDIALSPDGKYVYVADTWNHRIQKFTADGAPVTMWGKSLYHVTLGDPFGLWGPRGIAVDSVGRVYVADTGNKRIVIYDADGNYLSQFGGAGMGPGQLDEPVGIAVDRDGRVYVADTWNQRIQVFTSSDGGQTWGAVLQWDVSAWYGETLENKPLLALDNAGHLFVTDPVAGRILEFTTEGAFVRGWGEPGTGPGRFGLAAGVAVDPLGRVWVSDAAQNSVSRFVLP